MNTFLRNTNSKLYNAVSAPVAATRDALADRLQSVRETASLLYNKMMENMGYRRERLNDIVEKEAEGEQQKNPAVAKEEEEAKEQQQEPAAANNRMMMSDFIRSQNKICVRGKTCKRIQGDWKFKQLQHKDDHGQHHITH